MIDQDKIYEVVTKGLMEAAGCACVKANLADVPIPPYPYLSFKVLRTERRRGTWSVEGGSRFIPAAQVWGITALSDRDLEADYTAMKARDWLDGGGRLPLKDAGIVVRSFGAVENRDELLATGYEYRRGFEVTFSLMDVEQEEALDLMEQAEIIYKE